MAKIEEIRHSLAHILAIAVLKKFPAAKLGIGPAIENGFYYDIDLPAEALLAKTGLPELESSMREVIKKSCAFKGKKVSAAQAKKLFKGNKYKVELINEFSKKKLQLTVYQTDDFIDLCKGGHVKNTEEIPIDAFRLTKVAGAYWRGKEQNPMLTRIYGVAFNSKRELDEYLKMQSEAEKRDHRKLGERLELFLFHETAPGMPYWLPKGMIILNELIKFWKEEHQKRGYQEISTPLLNKKELYEISGHWQHYSENMFFAKTEEKEVYGIKPMNCANAMIVYKSKPRSYKELPLKLSDTDILHRFERSGTLFGLFRVRAFRQDDAHIFVSEDQILNEYNNILELIERFYSIFKLEYSFRLGTRPEKFIGDVKIWNKAEKTLKHILKNSNKKYSILEKDGAFYGPKIDILIRDSLGREWQMGTIQLDFQMPKNFGLTYNDNLGRKKNPVTIHRVIYGSLERFIGILLEHFAGALPLWLSPEQVWIIPVGSKHEKYAKEIGDQISDKGFRVTVKYENETVSKKIREGEMQKIPYLAVVGDEEIKTKSVRIRERGKGDMGPMKLNKFIEYVRNISTNKTIN